MIPFKRVWEDAINMVTKDQIKSVDIIEKYNTGFIVMEEGVTKFVTKDDFVEFWCKMLCCKEFSQKEASKNGCLKYVYDIIKNLPYVNENSGVLKLVD